MRYFEPRRKTSLRCLKRTSRDCFHLLTRWLDSRRRGPYQHEKRFRGDPDDTVILINGALRFLNYFLSRVKMDSTHAYTQARPRVDKGDTVNATHLVARWRVKPTVQIATAIVLAIAMPWSSLRAGTTPTYSIDFHRISSGSSTMRGNCARLSGTVGQPAPGYSSGSTLSIVAGFWIAAPTTGQDQVFFNGFEGC